MVEELVFGLMEATFVGGGDFEKKSEGCWEGLLLDFKGRNC